MYRTSFVALALLWGCTARVEPVRVPTEAQSEPGADGRPVLWLTPKAREAADLDAAAIAALGDADLSTEAGVLSLRSHLADPRPAVRAAVAKELARAERESAAFGLVLAAADRHPAVAAVALDALDWRPPERRKELFEHAVRAPEKAVARAAARVWPALLGEDAAAAVVAVADVAVDPVARATLLRGCVPAMSGAVGEPPADAPVVVRAAAEACKLARELGFKSEPVALIAALGSEDKDVRLLAARALFDLGPLLAREHGVAVREALTTAARTTDSELAVAVAAAQAAFGDAAALGMLAAFTGGGDSGARLDALTVLRGLSGRTEKLASDDLAPALTLAMEDEDPLVRTEAVTVAGATGDGRVTAALVRHLRDAADTVRGAAAYAIGQVGAKPAIAALMEIGIDDRVESVRDASYASLHHLVHELPLPPASMVASWLADPGPVKPGTFWGRDRERWRQWYQLER